MRRFRGRPRAAAGKRRSVKWGSAAFFGREVPLLDAFITTPPEVASFWFRWPSNIPDPANADNIPEEDTWIKCYNFFNCSSSTGGPQVPGAQFIYAGLIAWDCIEPTIYDNAQTQGIFPSPSDGNWDWIWRTCAPFNLLNSVQGLNTSFGAENEFHSKSMRKLPPGTGVVGLVSQANEYGQSQQISWEWDVRFAVKVEK